MSKYGIRKIKKHECKQHSVHQDVLISGTPFVTFYIMHSNAQEVLYKILLKDNKLTDCREEFDYTTSHFSMWQAYYHSNWAIFIPKIYKVDGLYASLGKFSFRALAKGYTEPTKDGKH